MGEGAGGCKRGARHAATLAPEAQPWKCCHDKEQLQELIRSHQRENGRPDWQRKRTSSGGADTPGKASA